jgi:hypothetical protein
MLSKAVTISAMLARRILAWRCAVLSSVVETGEVGKAGKAVIGV